MRRVMTLAFLIFFLLIVPVPVLAGSSPGRCFFASATQDIPPQLRSSLSVHARSRPHRSHQHHHQGGQRREDAEPHVLENRKSSNATSTPAVPAFFIFGDSTVDSGNNNFLLGALARADIPPYGRDFDSHVPTGRFCNGRLTVDFLALKLGLPFIPSYLGVGGVVNNMLQGVNFASAAAGVMLQSGADLGQHISLTQQIEAASDVFESMVMFEEDESKAAQLFSKSMFYFSIGNNDYIHLYLQNYSGVQSLHPPWKFNKLLVETLLSEVMILYNFNARNMVFMGMGPLGCAPRFLFENNAPKGKCVDYVNNMIIQYNYALREAVEHLNAKFTDANFIFCDVYYSMMDIIENPKNYGMSNVDTACCGLGRYGGLLMCTFPQMACNDASGYVWWDQYHPSAAVNKIMADNIWEGKYRNTCTPFSLGSLFPKASATASPSPVTTSPSPVTTSSLVAPASSPTSSSS